MKIQWLGGPSFRLELGRFRILGDPVFGEGDAAFTFDVHPVTGDANVAVKRLTPLPALDIDSLDKALSEIREYMQQVS